MRLVLLTREDVEHRYVTAALAAAFPTELQAVIVPTARRTSAWARLRRQARRYSPEQLASRLANRIYERVTRQREQRRRTLERVLPCPDLETAVGTNARVHRVASHNGAECLALLGEIRPTVIAVYGTAIIRPPVIRLAKDAILNLHTGVAPRYRGADCVFWALHNREPEWIGSTVHVLDEDIDTGPILGVGRPSLAETDDEYSLFGKCVALGADLYVDALRSIRAGRVTPRPQDKGRGREYRSVQRTVAADLRVGRLLRAGLLRTSSLRRREAPTCR